MQFLENISLKTYNTFGIDVKARFFIEVNTIEELQAVLKNSIFENHKKLFLGGGSNVLFLNDFDGLVIKINLKGIVTLEESDADVLIKAGAGEVWHEFVMHTVGNNWGGLENLSLIPGTVGAAPMQNIGAYGAEIKDTFEYLNALNLDTLLVEKFNKVDCMFGYRESYFKHQGKAKYVILEVAFKLNKSPEFKIDYGAIADTLKSMNLQNITVKDVSDAVIAIRKSKLPDPKQIGNSGSFFKNPEIPKAKYDQLKTTFDNMPSYVIDNETVKVPAGWLIEHAGWKGYRKGDVGVHVNQALVLVNYGNGTGQQIKQLAEEIQTSVFKKFGIEISPEVNFIY